MKIKKNTILLLITILLLCLLCIIYYSFYSFYLTRFLPNTYINEINVSGIEFKNAEKFIVDKTFKNNFNYIHNEEIIYTLPLETINYETKITEDIKEIKENQKDLFFIFNLFNRKEYNLTTENIYNEEKLSEKLNNINGMATNPINAYYIKEHNDFVLVKDIDGTKLDIEKILDETINNLNNNKYNLILKEDSHYLKAEINTGSKLIIDLENKINQLKISEFKYILPDKELIVNFNDLYDSLEIVDYNLTMNEEKIVSFLEKYKEPYSIEDYFMNYNNELIPMEGIVIEYVIDIEEIVNTLEERIVSLNTEPIIPSYNKNVYIKGNENKNAYIEISIEKQHMWFYKDGRLLIDTDIITGAADGYYDTPTGICYIRNKERSRYLQGNNKDGTRYKSWVEYWMPIDFTGVGIHDASWQASFGGTLYKDGKGSHGCINTPFENVKFIYENIELNTPVIIN